MITGTPLYIIWSHQSVIVVHSIASLCPENPSPWQNSKLDFGAAHFESLSDVDFLCRAQTLPCPCRDPIVFPSFLKRGVQMALWAPFQRTSLPTFRFQFPFLKSWIFFVLFYLGRFLGWWNDQTSHTAIDVIVVVVDKEPPTWMPIPTFVATRPRRW